MFYGMDEAMTEQQEAGPAKQQELEAQQGTLDSTNDAANTSQQEFEQASEGAQNLQQANDQKVAEAGQAREEARQQGGELDEAVTTKEDQAQTLSEQLQAWAEVHKAARQRAIESTRQRLIEEGYTVTESSEG